MYGNLVKVCSHKNTYDKIDTNLGQHCADKIDVCVRRAPPPSGHFPPPNPSLGDSSEVNTQLASIPEAAMDRHGLLEPLAFTQLASMVNMLAVGEMQTAWLFPFCTTLLTSVKRAISSGKWCHGRSHHASATAESTKWSQLGRNRPDYKK